MVKRVDGAMRRVSNLDSIWWRDIVVALYMLLRDMLLIRPPPPPCPQIRNVFSTFFKPQQTKDNEALNLSLITMQ